MMVNNYIYHVATILGALGLACYGPALLARCIRHLQSVFNLTVDILMGIRVMVN